MISLDSSRGYVTCRRGCAHWGPHGAAGLLLNHNGRLLLQQRAPWVHHGGTWSVPGGAMQRHETAYTAARREAREELGPLPPAQLITSHRNDHGGWSYHTVIASIAEPFTPGHGDGEGTRYSWLTPQEVGAAELHPGFRESWQAVAALLKEVHA
ncbi:NUDIX hydrolase [Streptomyces sp. NPDC006552]|uniref:NUDIX hydrolase n=1 Tax=Streptomyces sp. NPDC006552 TaxID=3157179 RepID=UPI0033BECF81